MTRYIEVMRQLRLAGIQMSTPSEDKGTPDAGFSYEAARERIDATGITPPPRKESSNVSAVKTSE